MVVGISVCELHIPGSRGLKEKRKVVKSLVDRIHKRFRVSVAETGLQDLHQRSEIGIALVAKSTSEAEHLLETIRSLFDAEFDAMVTRWEPEVLESV